MEAPDKIKEAFSIVECAATHNLDTCVRCGKGCDVINSLYLVRDYIFDTDIQKEAEQLYDNKEYSCAGYMCTVATTCYEPEEQRKICVDCIKGRYFGVDKNLYDNRG